MTFEQVGEKLYKEMFPASQKENMKYRIEDPKHIRWETDFCHYRIEAVGNNRVILSAYSKRSGGQMMSREFKVSGDRITQIDQSLDMMSMWSVFKRQYERKQAAGQ